MARRVAGSGGAVSRGGPYLAVRAKFQEINWVGGCLLVVPTPQMSSLYVKKPKNYNKNNPPPPIFANLAFGLLQVKEQNLRSCSKILLLPNYFPVVMGIGVNK